MDRGNRELLDRYIGRLLELKETRKWQLSEEELAEIALEIGLTEADLALAREEVESHIRRGATYASTRSWEAAALEYETAAELDPVRVQTQQVQLEITHLGTKSCRELVVVVEWLDEEGAVVRTRERAVVSLAHRPVEPGTRLIVSEQEYFDEEDFPAGARPFSDYRVYIRTAD